MKLNKLLILGLTLSLTACGGTGDNPNPKPTDMTKVLNTVLNFGENYRETVEDSFDVYNYGYPLAYTQKTVTVREGLTYQTSWNNVFNTLMTYEEFKNYLSTYCGVDEIPDEQVDEIMDMITTYYGYTHTVEGDMHRIYQHREELPEYYVFNLITPYIYEKYINVTEQEGRYYKANCFIDEDIATTVDSGFALNFLSTAKIHFKWNEDNNWFEYDAKYADTDGFPYRGTIEYFRIVLTEDYKLDNITFRVDMSSADYTDILTSTIKMETGGQKVVVPSEASLIACEHDKNIINNSTYNGEHYHYEECSICGDVTIESVEKCTFDEHGTCTVCWHTPVQLVTLIETDDHYILLEAVVAKVTGQLLYIWPNYEAVIDSTEDAGDYTIQNDAYVAYLDDYYFYSIYVYSFRGKTFAIEETGPKNDGDISRYVIIEDCTVEECVIKGGTITTYMTYDKIK